MIGEERVGRVGLNKATPECSLTSFACLYVGPATREKPAPSSTSTSSEKIYLFTKNLHQDKYQALMREFDNISN